MDRLDKALFGGIGGLGVGILTCNGWMAVLAYQAKAYGIATIIALLNLLVLAALLFFCKVVREYFS